MIRLIIRNLWARRRRNIWLLGELILVSVLTWNMVDPIVVMTHDRSLPLGYNTKGLYILSFGVYPSQSAVYQKAEDDSLQMMNNLFRLLDQVRLYPNIQSATPIVGFTYPSSGGNSSSGFQYDTLGINVSFIHFLPNSAFFETFGIRALEGKSTPQLDKYAFGQNDLVCTQNVSDVLFRGEKFTGKKLYREDEGDTIFYPIVGVVDNLRYYSFEQPRPLAFMAEREVNDFHNLKIVFRLKEGISESQFMHEFRSFMNSRLKVGNLFARSVISYDNFIKEREFENGVTNTYRMNTALCLFFLINLILGVVGTFWLQTRSRCGDVGVMLSYGANPSNILRMLLGEGVVLATVAVCIGCFIYLHFGLSDGLYMMGEPFGDYWINNFTLHFLVVSVIVYLIIVLVVLLGVYIPARKISRIHPTDALRDE